MYNYLVRIYIIDQMVEVYMHKKEYRVQTSFYCPVHGGEWNGEKSDIHIDLSVNTNPLGMPENVKKLFEDGSMSLLAERYPDRECTALRQALAVEYLVPSENIICGNGASELIMTAVSAFKACGLKRALIAVPSFSGYERSLKAYGIETVYHELKREDGFVLTDSFTDTLTENIRNMKSKGDLAVFLCNPNNPNGACIEKTLLEKTVTLCEENGVWLFLDECFIGFTGAGSDRSLKILTQDHKYLCVLDAFTKLYALPGLRIGFIFSGNDMLNENMRMLLPEWNVSALAQAAGMAALTDNKDYLRETVDLTERERRFLEDKLKALGFEVYPGVVNFIMFRTSEDDKFMGLQEKLMSKGVLIRSCENFHGTDDRDYRIAVRGHEENLRFIKILEELAG